MTAVRPARVEDAEQIAEVHVAGWRRAYRGLVPDELLASCTVPGRAEQWRQRLAAAEAQAGRPARPPGRAGGGGGGGQVWVIEPAVGGPAQGRPVLGFAAAGVSRDEDAVPSTAELYALYVHPDHWGSGYGYGLHSAAMSELAADHTVATLWVLETNARGRRFYERQGWCPDGTRKQEVHGAAVLDELRYRLDLGRGA